MAETDTSPPVTATSAASVKRERGSSPEQASDSSSLKRAKAENGDAVAVPAVPVASEVKEEEKDQAKETQAESTSATAPTENGNGHPAQKMNDDKIDGEGESSLPNSASSLAPPPASIPATPVTAGEPPVQNIQMRSLIVTGDASVIIGRAGAHVNEIRERSNARVTVSESIPGNPERILNVSGALDAVAKAFGLIVRRINDEPYDIASVPGSRAVTIKFIIPNSRMGSVIGKGGAKIKEIQEASGARLNASESMLPGSTERVLSVSGVADAVHIAVYYIGNILLEFNERNPGAATGLYRQQGARGGPPPPHMGSPMGGGGGGGGGGPRGDTASMPGAQTQQIFIPNALVGAIIGKAGAKINEIRQASQCQVRVTDPGTPATAGAPPNPEERLVTITGLPHNINTAVQMLYARLEQEKQKSMA